MWVGTPPSPAAVLFSSSYLVPSLVLHEASWDGRRQDLVGCFPRSEDLGFSVVNIPTYFVVVDPRASHVLGNWSTTEALGHTPPVRSCATYAVLEFPR